MDRTTYVAGWNDGIKHGREYTTLKQSRAGVGMIFFMLGLIVITCSFALPLSMWITGTLTTIVNLTPLVYLILFGVTSAFAGYFLDKRDEKRYKQREADFYKKWGDRWEELGFNGD